MTQPDTGVCSLPGSGVAARVAQYQQDRKPDDG
jgi:hypothetical protein